MKRRRDKRKRTTVNNGGCGQTTRTTDQRNVSELREKDMSAGCVRWLLSHTVRTVCIGRLSYWTPSTKSPICSERWTAAAAASSKQSPFSTEAENAEQTPGPKKKNPHAQAGASFSSIGRKVPEQKIQVISESGENLGTMHRVDVIRIMDEKNLKLVLLNKQKDPPVYQLMSGKQIHEKQMKVWEKNKAKAAPVQIKDLTLSADIGAHDRMTKLKQVENWLEKKHHVRITLRAKRAKPAENLDATLGQMVEEMDVMVGFVSEPKVIREGQSATCILRPPSAKELSQKGRNKAAEPQPPGSTSETSHSSTDTMEGSVQP